MQAPDFSNCRLQPDIDLAEPGKRSGHFALLWSDNDNPLGIHPVPVMCIIGAPGPTLVLIGGVHGDEPEGPLALMRLFRAIDPEEVTGRLIFLPALNAPAVRAGRRVSPLDGGNLNRAFPGDAEGGPTAQIADMVVRALLPVADAVIDLHAGGAASWFAPCALAARQPDGTVEGANLDLARAFGTPLIWVLGAANDDRSVNGAATRAGVPCIAAELGGGGAASPATLQMAEGGLRACLQRLGHLDGTPPAPAPARLVELAGQGYRLTAPGPGIYEPCCNAGDDITAGALLGRVHDPDHPGAPATEIFAPKDGLILAETRRATVFPGAFLAFLATELAS